MAVNVDIDPYEFPGGKAAPEDWSTPNRFVRFGGPWQMRQYLAVWRPSATFQAVDNYAAATSSLSLASDPVLKIFHFLVWFGLVWSGLVRY